MKPAHCPPFVSLLFAGVIAMIATLSAGGAETVPSQPSFLKIARNPNSTAAQKLTVTAMLKFAGEDDLERAYKKLKKADTMVFYGGDSYLSDLSPLAEFIQLKTLVLYNNHIEDLSPLASLTNLETLRLEINRIQDISPLKHLDHLESLQIDDNQISDLRPLAQLGKLRTLWLSRNKITDVRPLEALAALRDLSLTGNRLRDLKPLTGLALCTLHLDSNGISDISDLKDMNQKTTCFISLDLKDNAIVDIASIGQLERISDLNLSGNLISDIRPLKNPKLFNLDLHNNRLTDTAPLREIRSLSHVDVTDNPIKDYSNLLALKGEKPKLEIIAGEPFEEAYRKSIPIQKELVNSPLVGIWRTDIQESEWGPLTVEMRFDSNGICYLTLRSSGPNQKGLVSSDGLFSTKGNILKQTIRGDESKSEFKVKDKVLTLTRDGQITELKKVGK